MRLVADLHIHSPYARAVSRDMTLKNLDHWARLKGITVVGTGDFTHPTWMREIKGKLESAEPGLYVLKSKSQIAEKKTRFMLTVEISSIYSKGGKVRRIHNLIFAPSIAAAEKITTRLGRIGNLAADGRPTLGLDCKELVKIVLNIDPQAVIVPAHAWTPWFSIFGSMSGFDSLEECFEEFTPQIFAIETGLSSDPAMNWRLSKLDSIALISNSDSHSLQRIGREANAFDCEPSYAGIINAIRSRDPQKFLFTVEFFPEEGKYHYDGHRLHQVRLSPEQTGKLKGLCPVCSKPVTIGVMHRVEKLADRPPGGKAPVVIPYKNLIPLDEIIAEAFGMGVAAKRVKDEYLKLVTHLGSEFNVLLDTQAAELERVSGPVVAQGILRVREGRVKIEPGYDGEYGRIKIFEASELKPAVPQQPTLF